MSSSLKRHPGFAPRGQDQYVEVKIASGVVYASFSDRGISMVHPASSARKFEAIFGERTGRPIIAANPTDHVDVAEAILTGETRNLEFDLDGVSPFTRRVLFATMLIKRGETRSYQWLARSIGMPRAARAVGNALGSNPLPILIPCHRIVRGDGSLGGYAFGSRMKQSLLAAEGALLQLSVA